MRFTSLSPAGLFIVAASVLLALFPDGSQAVTPELVARRSGGFPVALDHLVVRLTASGPEDIVVLHEANAGALLQFMRFDQQTTSFRTRAFLPLRSSQRGGIWRLLRIPANSAQEPESLAIYNREANLINGNVLYVVGDDDPRLISRLHFETLRPEAIADFDFDGDLDVVVAENDASPPTLSLRDLGTMEIAWSVEGYFWQFATWIGQLDGDRSLELILNSNESGVVLDALTGEKQFEYAGGFGDTVLVGNLAGDAPAEFLSIGYSVSTVFGLEPPGPLWQFPAFFRTSASRKTLGDIDNDGVHELWGEDYGAFSIVSMPDNQAIASIDLLHGFGMPIPMDLDADGLSELVMRPTQRGGGLDIYSVVDQQLIVSTPASAIYWLEVGDVDGDGRSEVVTGSAGTLNGPPGSSGVHVWNMDSGELEAHWPLRFFGAHPIELTGLTVGQLDVDEQLEIAVALKRGPGEMGIQVLDARKAEIQWSRMEADLGRFSELESLESSEGNFGLAVAFRSGQYVGALVLDGSSGTEKWRTLMHNGTARGAHLTVGDLDEDGETELGLGSALGFWAYSTDGTFDWSDDRGSDFLVFDQSSGAWLAVNSLGNGEIVDVTSRESLATLDLHRNTWKILCVQQAAPGKVVVIYEDWTARLVDLRDFGTRDTVLPLEVGPEAAGCSTVPASAVAPGDLIVPTNYGFAHYRLYPDDWLFGGIGGGFESPSP